MESLLNPGHPPALWTGTLLMLAGIALYLSLLHGWFALRGINSELHSAFAVLCLSTAIFISLEVVIYGVTTAPAALWFSHRLLDSAALFYVCLPRFLRAYTRQPLPWLVVWSCYTLGLLAILRWFDPEALSLVAESPFERFELPWGEVLNIPRYRNTPLLTLGYLTALIGLLAVIAYCRRLWCAGERKYAIQLSIAFAVFLGCVIMDMLRDLWASPLPYVSEFAFVPFIIIIARDLARSQVDAVLVREQLMRLSTEMALTEERERRRLAEALHDAPVQWLAIALLKLEAVGDREPCSEESYVLIRQALRELRSTTVALSPPVLYQVGLHAALQWLAEDVERRQGLSCHCRCVAPPPVVPENARVVLYQCARELVNNVVKHANATRIELSLDGDERRVTLIVEDNGRGLADTNPPAYSEREGFGLFSLRQRLAPLRGRLLLASGPKGTRVTVTLELDCHDQDNRCR